MHMFEGDGANVVLQLFRAQWVESYWTPVR